MAVLLKRSRWPNKPPLGSQINWAHPLAQSIIGAWLLNDGSGKTYSSITGMNHGSADSATYDKSVWGPSGLEVGASSSTDLLRVPGSGIMLPDSYTAVVRVCVQDFSAERAIVCWNRSSCPGWQLMPSTRRVRCYAGTSCHRYFNAMPNVVGWHTFVCSLPGAAQTDINNASLWIDGSQMSVYSTSATGAQTTKTGAFYGGSDYWNPFSKLEFVYLLNRAVTDAEATMLSASPYALVEPKRNYYSIAAAGGSFQAAWAANSNQIIGGF